MMLLQFFPVFPRELMFLGAGIIIGMTTMLFLLDRHERRMIARYMAQVKGLMGQINELSRKHPEMPEHSQERPPARGNRE